MTEYICLKCHNVYTSKDPTCHCGGETEKYSPSKHANLLVGSSNSWNQIKEHSQENWESHPLYEEVQQDHHDRGSYGAARIMISFVNRLIEKVSPMTDQTLRLQSDALADREKKLEKLTESYKRSQDEVSRYHKAKWDLEIEIRTLKDQLELSQTSEGRELLRDFPDLHYHTNRWKTRRLTSKLATPKCTDADIGHNCGCCNDSPIEVWPYMLVGEIKIHADPIPYCPGERGWGCEEASAGWEEDFRKRGVPEVIIERVQNFFDANQRSEEDED